jgi:hypothetical protein
VTCLLCAWSTHLGWITVAIALTLTWGSLWFTGRTFAAMQPVTSAVGSVEMVNAPPRTVIQMLRVAIESPHTSNCTRESQIILYRSEHGTPATYPLGSTMSGDGLPGMIWSSATRHDFILNLPIPPAIPDGEYELMYRSVYSCSWLGGLIQRQLHQDSPPVPVRVGTP